MKKTSRPLLLLQNLLTASRRPVFPCLAIFARCSIESMSSHTMMPVSVSQSPSDSFRTIMVLILRVMFHSLFEDALLPNFSKIVGLHQKHKTSSTSYARIAGLLNIPCIGSGANDGGAERRKMRWHVRVCCIRDISIAVHCFL